MPPSFVVIVPTRNRAALAKNAIGSVLSQAGTNVRLLVSDNSTTPAERAELAAHCSQLADPRLQYVNPPEPLPMPAHWEFAVGYAQENYDATHFVILTDRMMFRAGMLAAVTELVAERPDDVLSYNDDMVHDLHAPVRLERKPLTGKVFDLEAEQLLYLSSIGVFPQALPRMLNCVVPRGLLAAIRTRFGDVYTSVAPDLCHAYRCMALRDRVRYFDAPVMVQYGFAKSNGTGYYAGKTNDAWADFNRCAGARGITFAAPVPEVCCNLNVVYHEYCFVREQANDPARFPAVDWKRYVHAIANDIQSCANPETRAALFATLKARVGADLAGWTPPPAAPPAPPAPRRSLWAKLRDAARAARGEPAADGTFRTTAAALAYSHRTAPAYVPINDHVQYMQRGWKLAG
ncbi:glycosyltransferase [Gemmata sp. JC673]|uniref:Glycosyltransferase n=1 Tax=Gemmata algarum TaxID=2975278 RepID=A0ABU5F8F9_9BACT|nr:glycosyltransferase family A protein [Gemmata algarum]MDY3563408.1 glycosyltransferase [Gemmata algarum]